MATEKWTIEEAHKLRANATALFSYHGHANTFGDADDEAMTRTSCGACRLAGYEPLVDDGMPPAPNYGGWARVYVEAGRPVPFVFREAFEDERVSENTRYAAGLARDIATFGVKFAPAKEESA